jgi:drug/metabolite transporter (DMT)-like permease
MNVITKRIPESQKGIVYMLLAVVFFSGMNASVKMLGHLPAHELIFWRSIISFSISFLIIKRLGLSLPGNNTRWLLVRGIAGTVALFLFFLSLRMMPLATASTIQYLSPIFTVVFATYFNHQKVKPSQWALFALAFLGVLCIKGFDDRITTEALVTGVASAAVAGLAYNAIIKCKDTDHPVVIMIYFPLMSLPVMGGACLLEFRMPEITDWIFIGLMGLTAQVAQYCTTIALQSDSAARVAPWNYVGAVLAVINGYVFFHESIGPMAIVGMVIIVLALIWSARLRHTQKDVGK